MSKYKNLFILFGAVVGAQVLIGIVAYFSFDQWATRGAFGDMFGAVNTLFSGLAFCGVIYAIILQSQELKLQREELELTRTELAKSAQAQQDQAKQMQQAAKLNAVSVKLNTYTTLLVNKRTIPGVGGARYPLEDTLAEFEKLISENV